MNTHIRLCSGLALAFVLVFVSQYFSGLVPLIVEVPTVSTGVVVMLLAVIRWVYDVYYIIPKESEMESEITAVTNTVALFQEELEKHTNQIRMLTASYELGKLYENGRLTSDGDLTLHTGVIHQDGVAIDE
tara:strand:- start:16 stop:408 length:393 start_codon:yes stop_codon:yes gene_type:complete